MTDQNNGSDDVFDWGGAMAKFAPKVDSRKAGRKARQKQIASSTDGRSLRATGRTEQLNIKVSPNIAKALNEHVGKGGKSLWLEEAIIAKLKAEGYEIDG